MTAVTAQIERWRLGHRPSLDGVRGLAVALVVLSHAEVPWFAGFSATWGMVLFFVLSGFLITALLLDEHADTGRIRLGAFYIRRARRLFPALLLLLAVVTLYLGATGQGGDVPKWVLPPLLYVANWAAVVGHDMGFLNHTWSLSVEEQFYLLWPLVLLVTLTITKRLEIALLVAGIGIAGSAVVRLAVWDPNAPARVFWATDTRGDALLIGCALAIVLKMGLPVRAQLVAIMGAMAIGAGLLMQFVILDALWAFTVVAVMASLLIYGSLIKGPAAWALSRRPMRYLGRISYGVYLWHFPLFVFLYQSERAALPLALRALIVIVGSVVLAALPYHLWEFRWLRRRGEPSPNLSGNPRSRTLNVASSRETTS